MHLIKPKAEEIYSQTVSMWVFQLKFLSINTPRDFVDVSDLFSSNRLLNIICATVSFEVISL